ncbi:siderophore iron transporter mirB [Niveomyces insectorum RCEF 264]|uniref:Siderophore iron transporter mirB n=1 Tax=Niveomyces insectorum RCEF 264 TaxID=1081102 RepID=A0A167SKH5_9HYPO|nr:siderophore iron transporter mirB [Niveomyces insectorum RCEF 264]
MNGALGHRPVPLPVDSFSAKGQIDVVVDRPDRDFDGNSSPKEDSDEPIHKDAQAGVQDIEAIATAWTRNSLIVAYVMIWIIYFVVLMQSTALGTLTAYVTSSFGEHSLTSTVNVLASVIGGVSNLTLAKILDVWGRHHGVLVSVVLATLGLIMMAACNTVELYAAAEVFYTVGVNALQYSLNIIIADTSTLRKRGLMLAYAGSPSIVTTWLSGPISQAYLDGPGWRWAFGTFAIIIPAVSLPFYGLLLHNLAKAKKRGILPKRDSQRTALQSVLYYCRQFDAVGLLLISGGLALFLLPFNIYSFQAEGWRAPIIICFLVFGFALMVVFVLWEKFFAPVTFIPYSLLLDRTVLGSCILGGVLFVSYYCWFYYFSSFLQVVNDLSVTRASYVANAYGVGVTVFSLVSGWVINQTGHYKYVNLFIGLPLSILGTGLMMHFRNPNGHYGYLVMCQIFLSMGNGFIIVCDEVAVMAATSHQYIAVVLAVTGMFSGVGGAVGGTVASAIWQSVFPTALAKYLPAADLPNLEIIYGSLPMQLSFPVGSDTRLGIQRAYGEAQKTMLIAGTTIWAVGIVSVIFWRDTNVKGIKQVKGIVI